MMQWTNSNSNLVKVLKWEAMIEGTSRVQSREVAVKNQSQQRSTVSVCLCMAKIIDTAGKPVKMGETREIDVHSTVAPRESKSKQEYTAKASWCFQVNQQPATINVLRYSATYLLQPNHEKLYKWRVLAELLSTAAQRWRTSLALFDEKTSPVGSITPAEPDVRATKTRSCQTNFLGQPW